MNTSKQVLFAVLFGSLTSTAMAQNVPQNRFGPPADSETAKPIRPADDLHLQGEHNTLRVIGGSAGEQVAILIGLEESCFPLPGGATLRLYPLAVLALGVFDVDGQFEVDLQQADGERIEPIKVYAQAISVSDETEGFRTSGLLEIESDGSGELQMREMPKDCIAFWLPQSRAAIRRQLVA